MKKNSAQLPLAEYLGQFIKASISGRRLTPARKRISKGTITGHLYAKKLIDEFENKNNITLRLQLLHRASMRTLQKERNYWGRGRKAVFFIFSLGQWTNLSKAKNLQGSYRELIGEL